MTEGRRSRKEEIHPSASRCLFQLTPRKLTRTHICRHCCHCQDCSTDCLQPVGIRSVFLSTAAGHDRMFISQCQTDTVHNNRQILLSWREVRENRLDRQGEDKRRVSPRTMFVLYMQNEHREATVLE